MTRRLPLIALCCTLVSLSSCSGEEPARPVSDATADAAMETHGPDAAAGDSLAADTLELPEAPEGLAFWYESGDLAPLRDSLPWLAAHGLEVNLALHEGETDFAGLDELLPAAAEAKVRIHIWPLLHPDDGYFPNVRNADRFATWWDELVTRAETRGDPVSTFVVDMEPPLDVLREVQRIAADTGNFMEAIDYLVDRYDAAVYSAGRARLAALVADTQNRGYRVVASTLFFVLDDFADGDDDIQRVFDSPIADMGFDEVSFQVYRSAFNDILGGTLLEPGVLLSPFVVYDYAATAREHFDTAAALDLGLVGSPGYEQPVALLADIAAARGAGIPLTRLNVYSLQAVLEDSTTADAWVALDGVLPEVPEEDRTATLMRGLVQAVDKGVSLP